MLGRSGGIRGKIHRERTLSDLDTAPRKKRLDHFSESYYFGVAWKPDLQWTGNPVFGISGPRNMVLWRLRSLSGLGAFRSLDNQFSQEWTCVRLAR